MEESSKHQETSEICIPSNNVGIITNGNIDNHIKKQKEYESNNISLESKLSTNNQNDDLFGVQLPSTVLDRPPPYSNNGNTRQYVSSLNSPMYKPSQLRNFQYDVVMIYDPNTDFHAAQDLLKLIEPQNLKIFDFARDCPPGMSQKDVFAAALDACKFTCIVVTRNFIQNFWLKFKADMALQDMIQNEHKQYSLVVVVMDYSMKEQDLPLDLQTISPIYQSERFFKNRLNNAFADGPFPMMSGVRSSMPFHSNMTPPYQSSSGIHQSFYDQHSKQQKTESLATQSSFHESDFSKHRNSPSFTPSNRTSSVKESIYDRATPNVSFRSQFERPLECRGSSSDSEIQQSPRVASNHSKKQTISRKLSSSDSSLPLSPRQPQEHNENDPKSSIFEKIQPLPSMAPSSIGRRQPVEASDNSMATTSSNHSASSIMTSLPSYSISVEDQGKKLSSIESSTLKQLIVDPEHFSFEKFPSSPESPSDDSIDRITLEISNDELPQLYPVQQGVAYPMHQHPSQVVSSDAESCSQKEPTNAESCSSQKTTKDSQSLPNNPGPQSGYSADSERSVSMLASIRHSFNRFRKKF